MKRSSQFSLVCVLVCFGLPVTTVYADDTAAFITGRYASGLRTTEMMHIIDTNKDGKISKDEWIAYQDRVFTALDKDKDGFLESGEFMSASDNTIPFATIAYSSGLRTKEMFSKLDVNGDGKISRDEFLNYQMKVFDMMDTGKKQELSVADFIVK
jgi:Ca2+-binding EF-hand superfamily protein